MKRSVPLSSSEIGSLWGAYQQDDMAMCFLKYFLHHTQDQELKALISKSMEITQSHLKKIEQIFHEEKIPVPHGFSDDDVDLTTPPLFQEFFGLGFVYSMSRLEMITYAFIASSVARADIREYFTNCLNDATTMYNESTTLLLEKGIYDRPPMISYPKQVKYIQKESVLSGYLGKKRPLNAIELSEIFLNIERNYFGIMVSIGFLQVIKDKQLIKYLESGKEISEKQVKILNDLLMEEELLGLVPMTMQVTDSTISPFSDRLIVLLFHSLNSLDITLIGHALSLSMRADLTLLYSELIVEILAYAKKGFDIMVNRKWLEQPPQATNRRDLIGE